MTRVLTNGNLVVQGESWITINQGREFIRLSGIVRSEILSLLIRFLRQRLADACINDSGSGMVGNVLQRWDCEHTIVQVLPLLIIFLWGTIGVMR